MSQEPAVHPRNEVAAPVVAQPGAPTPSIPTHDEALAEHLRELRTAVEPTQHQTTEIDAQTQQSSCVLARASVTSTPWQQLAGQNSFFALLLVTVAVVLFLRLVQLDSLQNEIYGDIQIVHQYVNGIRNGERPINFVLSAGPLYHYAIVPIIALTGLNYFGLKVASVVTSLGVVFSTYLLSRRLVNDHFALLATFIAGISSWLLVFSRLGNSQIIVPLLVTCTLWLVVRIAQGSQRDVVACAVVSALGLYCYPQSFILPLVTWFTLLCLRWTGHPISWSVLRRFVLVTALCALPFAWIVSKDPYNFFSGYIGGKLTSEGGGLNILVGNILRALLAFHVRGDTIYRSNPPGLPHLDPMSGVLFLGGITYWLLPQRRRWSPVVLLPFVLLQVPSMLVLSQPGEIPSASRTLGVAPLAAILAASGLWWLGQSLYRRSRHWLAPAVIGVVLVAMLLLNVQRYFQVYVNELPYQNTPIGRTIATYADTLSADTQIYIVGCCWESMMPETPFVKIMTARPQNMREVEPNTMSCDQLSFLSRPAVFVWSFRAALPAPQLAPCAAWLPAQVYYSPQGLPIFNAAPLRPDLGTSPLATQPDVSQAGEPLEYHETLLDERPVGVRHSPLDIGSVMDLFDGKRETLLRGRSANPLVLEVRLGEPRPIRAIAFDLTTMAHFTITVDLTLVDGTTKQITQEYNQLPRDPHVEVAIPDGPLSATIVRLEIKDLLPAPTEGYHIHVREIQLR